LGDEQYDRNALSGHPGIGGARSEAEDLTSFVAREPTRTHARGKHLWADGTSLRVHGVTYGSFATRADKAPFPSPERIYDDFVAMRTMGIDCVRVYETPPIDLLDAAADLGMRVLVGLHYDDWRMAENAGLRTGRRIRDAGFRAVDDALELLAGRPEVLAVSVGNEVPVDLVRLHGRHSVEKTLTAMVARLHAGDPELLATYVNFPTTEFLEIPNVDVIAYNVFLEERDEFHRYVEHLQMVSRDKPLLIAEFGLASEVHTESAQAKSVAAQLEVLDQLGTAGGFVFSWTDEWAVGGTPVTGWGFGITDIHRQPKPVCRVVSEWATRTYPKGLREAWPRVSVIICAYNEETTIADCVDSVVASSYPDLELIVCDDGSTDTTAEIVEARGGRLLRLDHGGLSRARNSGLEASSGEIIAYLDADAACHPDWPYHLALSFEAGVAAAGGPNLPYPVAGLTERAIAHVPGQASEVLIGPSAAEHVPGCNMAFRRDRLIEVGGFDVRYVAAGDDVDACWKVLDSGHRIGFSAAAQVDHHRRSTIRGFLRQQRGYGRAERMLAGPHRHRINTMGQARWAGFVYGPGAIFPRLLRPSVYTGWTGTAPFQPAISQPSALLGGRIAITLPLVVVAGVMATLAGLVISSSLLAIGAAAAMWIIGSGVAAATSAEISHTEPSPLRVRGIVGILTVLAPLARTWGRVTGATLDAAPAPPATWQANRSTWIDVMQRQLRGDRHQVRVGGSGDFWDLEVSDGGPAAVRVTTAVAWAWQPLHALRLRLRISWIVSLLAVTAVAAFIGGAVQWVAIIGSPMVIATSAVHTRRAVVRAIEASTSGATTSAIQASAS
jgi:glycosyltransferase involved in cell wall biosynthesis